MEFKDKLKELRKKANISQAELAQKIYVSRSAVAKWENGLGLPADDSLDALAKFFCVSKSQLIGDKQTELVFVEKNKTVAKQKNYIIIIWCALLVLAIAFFITVPLLLAKWGSETLSDNSKMSKVIDNVEYKLLYCESAPYYEVAGVTDDYTYQDIRLENEFDGVPVTTIGVRAFEKQDIKNIYFNDNLKRVGDSAFLGASIDGVYFNAGLEEIGVYAFRYSYNFTGVEFPSSLKKLEYGAFASSGLESVIMNENLEEIGDFAFAYCANLNHAEINSNAKIGNQAFMHTSLRRITFNKPEVILTDKSFFCNYILYQIEFNGTLAQWNAATAHTYCFEYTDLYIKFAGSREYKIASRDYLTGMWSVS